MTRDEAVEKLARELAGPQADCPASLCEPWKVPGPYSFGYVTWPKDALIQPLWMWWRGVAETVLKTAEELAKEIDP